MRSLTNCRCGEASIRGHESTLHDKSTRLAGVLCGHGVRMLARLTDCRGIGTIVSYAAYTSTRCKTASPINVNCRPVSRIAIVHGVRRDQLQLYSQRHSGQHDAGQHSPFLTFFLRLNDAADGAKDEFIVGPCSCVAVRAGQLSPSSWFLTPDSEDDDGRDRHTLELAPWLR